jgi:hypothetical protein
MRPNDLADGLGFAADLGTQWRCGRVPLAYERLEALK